MCSAADINLGIPAFGFYICTFCAAYKRWMMHRIYTLSQKQSDKYGSDSRSGVRIDFTYKSASWSTVSSVRAEWLTRILTHSVQTKYRIKPLWGCHWKPWSLDHRVTVSNMTLSSHLRHLETFLLLLCVHWSRLIMTEMTERKLVVVTLLSVIFARRKEYFLTECITCVT